MPASRDRFRRYDTVWTHFLPSSSSKVVCDLTGSPSQSQRQSSTISSATSSSNSLPNTLPALAWLQFLYVFARRYPHFDFSYAPRAAARYAAHLAQAAASKVKVESGIKEENGCRQKSYPVSSLSDLSMLPSALVNTLTASATRSRRIVNRLWALACLCRLADNSCFCT